MPGLRAVRGDVIFVEGRHVRQPGRMGEILEVLGESGHEYYRVRWEHPETGTAGVHRRQRRAR
jgi:hypothetical protein